MGMRLVLVIGTNLLGWSGNREVRSGIGWAWKQNAGDGVVMGTKYFTILYFRLIFCMLLSSAISFVILVLCY